MIFFLLLHLLVSPDLFADQEVTNCESKFVKKQFKSYESAKQYVQNLGFKTSKQFREWSRSGKRPEDFPSNPRNAYKLEWKNWGEFLGTGNVHKKNVRSYESAKKYIQALGIKTRNQFQEWVQSDEKPDDIPFRPDYVYRLKWISWSEFLGTGRGSKKGWRSYESAQALMKELGISEERQFRKWSRSGERPLDFPSNPDRVYKSEWNGWGVFLSKKGWRSYEAAQMLMKELGIKTVRQFWEWSQTGKRPLDFPSNPDRFYKSEWTGWGAFLWDPELSEGMGLYADIELSEDTVSLEDMEN